MRDRYRPWLAALLALVIAGLGHAYLRRWGRALLWFATILGGALALTFLYSDPTIADPTELPQDVLLPVFLLFMLSALDAFLVARQQIAERRQREAVTAVTRANAGGRNGGGRDAGGRDADGQDAKPPEGTAGGFADAIPDDLTGGEVEGAAESVQCPNCGKETDATIDFCHWCTNEFPWADDDGRQRR